MAIRVREAPSGSAYRYEVVETRKGREARVIESCHNKRDAEASAKAIRKYKRKK